MRLHRHRHRRCRCRRRRRRRRLINFELRSLVHTTTLLMLKGNYTAKIGNATSWFLKRSTYC